MSNLEQLEAKCETLRKAIEGGDMTKLGAYAYALAAHRANQLGVDMPDLEHVETFTPQAQVDTAYVQYLEARKASLERAIAEARYWLDQHAPGRACEVLRQIQTS